MSRVGRAVRDRRVVAVGVVGGIAHVLAVGLLWAGFGFESLAGTASTEPRSVAHLLTGTFAVGVVPGVGYARRQLASPVVVVAGLVVATGVTTWLRLRGGATPIEATAFGRHALLWPVTLVLGAPAGAGEYRLADS